MDAFTTTKANQAVDTFEQAQLTRLRAASDDGGARAGKVVEKVFASMLVKELRRGLDNGFFKGPGSQVYTAWLDEHLGNALTERDTLGLAGMVKTYVDRKAAETAEEPQA